MQQIVMRHPRHHWPIDESDWRKNYGSLSSNQT